MYFGEVVETAPAARLFTDPEHAYTRQLVAKRAPHQERVTVHASGHRKEKETGGDGQRLFVPAERTKRRPEAIADRIKDYIRLKDWGRARLPQERDLIDTFKAAKGTVREAMKALETQGLVFTRSGPGGGAFVAKPSARHAMELLSTHFFSIAEHFPTYTPCGKMLEPEWRRSLPAG